MSHALARYWVRALAPVLLMTACGDSSSGSSPGATSDASAAGGVSGSGGSAGTGGGQGNATSAESGPGSCGPKLISTDPGCPSDETQVATMPNLPSCSAEGTVCKYQESTLVGATCAPSGQSIYACCAGRWTGADVCPKAVPGQNSACPVDLPYDNAFNPAPCSTSGLKCGYYPVGPQDTQQQDIACCPANASLGQTGLHWRFCFAKTVQGAPTAPSCACP